ncbi:MAG: methyltransferase [Promethearchaeota archaeon]
MKLGKNNYKPVDFTKLSINDYFGLKIVVPNQVYSPMEDTDLSMRFLLQWVRKLEKSNDPIKYNLKNPCRILEMGCGSGILSLVLVNHFVKYKIPFYHTGIDINPLACETASYNAKMNHLQEFTHFYKGKFFAPLQTPQSKEPYDVIIFNPPYLASELDTINDSNRQLIDLAWEGGEEGNEVTLEFLSKISPFLKPQGELMLISSERINQKPILEALEKVQIEILEIMKQHVFFEDILLYHGKRIKN